MKKSKRYIKKQNNKPLIDVTEELEDKAYEEMRHN